MAIYLNWMEFSQTIKGDLVPTEGNPVADHLVLTSGVASTVAPVGAQYASVWSTAAATVAVSDLGGKLGENKTYALPANVVLQIPNIVVNSSTITVTDI